MKMLPWLLTVLDSKPVHSFHMGHLSRAKHRCRMSYIIQNQLYPLAEDMTQKHHKHARFQVVSLVA